MASAAGAPGWDDPPDDVRVRLPGGPDLRALLWRPAGTAHRAAAGPTDPLASVPFLLVHGLASNAHLWDGVARHLRAAGFSAAAVDLRGHGASDKPDAGYDFETIAADIHALVQALSLGRPVIAGQSWGAGVALEAAVRYPALARGIALVDGGFEELARGFATFEACWERLAPPIVSGTPADKVERFFRVGHPDWSDEAIAASMANFEIGPTGTVELRLTRDRHKAILRAIWEQRTSRLLAEVRVPVLLVAAEDGGHAEGEVAADERATPRRAAVEAAGAAFARSGTPHRIHWMRGDHDLHAQHPAEIAGMLVDAVRDGFFA